MAIIDPALWCVVPAAGRGARVGGDVPKQYLPIVGKPMLLHTLQRLAAHPAIAGIVVVIAAGDKYWPGWNALAGKPVRVTTGGESRADSVVAGLAALPDAVAADDFVLVHDAARPCVRAADISRLLELGRPAGGGLLAAPVRDTLKRGATHVDATQPRHGLWRALTPQMFRRAALLDALRAAARACVAVTDESMAMELAGARPLLVEGSEDNIKVTTAADLELARYLLAETE